MNIINKICDIFSVLRGVRSKSSKPDNQRFSQHSLDPEQFVANQNFDLSNIPTCPQCGSEDVAKMIYGKPALTKQILQGLESGKIISGGCMIHGGAPEWHCNCCNQDFGHLNFAPAATGEQP